MHRSRSAALSSGVGDRACPGGEAAAVEEIEKSRISSKRVPLRIDHQEHEVHVSRLQATLERLEGGVALAKACVHERHRILRNVPLLSERFQRVKHLARFGCPTQLGEDVAAKRDHLAVGFTEPLGNLYRSQHRLMVAQLLVHLGELELANPELRIEGSG